MTEVFRNLMAEEELGTLGFGESREYVRVVPEIGRRERSGFIAGNPLR